ncbi:uncharacterized protein LOC106070068 isoform X1 [Biomphalaria glabrata]|uniref:Uncharacterized protein LOC106070068 isoform X1 n=1 Tax=Biomphalaria glabrata TaxID=6526 RepID=A0A2C9KRQ1_BIOGL|nr:uncharacterized protein LOC106070068 isoform X1 [Biomphalaria glabrata]XP_013085350.1 uncharacterized protein LOC106070068 isoform X1 [Biomphalaria glabrata]XP_013085351.1 uncharacterized protein LOC106070068 isoform X1 [Biomphalaria glabrata]XP_055868657.1 uncharacterized protein LOC106070068 isoform X1 [Biomphalaria glabrata]
MEPMSATTTLAMPRYLVRFNHSLFLNSLLNNISSRSTLITILTQTTSHSPVVNNNVEGGSGGASNDEDLFGEHYFHICIYIWACVVVSSLIALSVVIFHIAVIYCQLHLSLQKWGCCGRSLTRWEVKRIPLRRFQKTEGDDCQDKCPICHEEFNEGRLIRQLPCNHCYHSYCVDRWLVKMSNRCPLCKQRVSISLFCPWNKQQRKKEMNGLITAQAEAEASVDESLPLPPLSTLTPQNWYGEDIMSGPSKFIIMRPGRPTRVIDVREQKKKVKAEQEAKALAKRQHDEAAALSEVPEGLEEEESLLKNVSRQPEPVNVSCVDSADTRTLACKCVHEGKPCLSYCKCREQDLLLESECTASCDIDESPVLGNHHRNLTKHSKTDLSKGHFCDPLETTITLNSRSSSVVSANHARSETPTMQYSNDKVPSTSVPIKHRTWPENLNQCSSEVLELNMVVIKSDSIDHIYQTSDNINSS